MFQLEKIVRPNILHLKPYSSARDEYTGKDAVFLDANENPFGELNRYPDPHQTALKEKLSSVKNTSTENIFIGNGSDEVIDIAYRTFCEPGKDKALTFSPTYGMYDVSAAINNIELIKIPLTENFQIDLGLLNKYIDDENLKLIFICSPNNPSGNNLDNIEDVLKRFKGIVFVDEAYIDFSDSESFLSKLSLYPNIIISQTFSKARGLAAARVGTAFASKEIIYLYNKVKPPYNVSKLNQEAALQSLEDEQQFEENKNTILAQRIFLQSQLAKISLVKKIYPTDANFMLVEVEDADKIYNDLVNQKVITRNRNSVVKNCIRITVGSEAENKKLIFALKIFESSLR
ncbi:MAG: histidinol-phosphate transaminase [Bacteroidia bacterium]